MLRRTRKPRSSVPTDGAAAAYTIEGTLEPWARDVVCEAEPYTMTSRERLVAVVDATRYVVGRGVPGALVECGVWRGGSVLTMIRTLQHVGVDDRDVYLFDTFEGMTAPTDEDRSPFDGPASDAWQAAQARGERAFNELFRAEVFNLADLQAMLAGTGYPPERLHFVTGPVEDTLPDAATGEIALLRLDTDWYSSTRHELVHLYPRLRTGGVLIVDDYGHWQGCRQAVDEYFAASAEPLLFSRTDYTGRMAVKH